MNRIALIFLCILLCESCSNHDSNTVVITKFEKTGTLTATVKEIPEPVLLPRFMGIANDLLFVYKEKEEKLFGLFSLPQGTYIGSAGSRGQGPDEFYGLLDTRSFSAIGESFSVMEAGANIYKTVVYKAGHLSVTSSKNLLQPGVQNVGFYPLKDNVYLTLGDMASEEEYTLFDAKDNSIRKIGTYPRWTSAEVGYEAPARFFTYIKSCVVHPQRDKFAAFYGYFKRLRIYDAEVRLLHDIDVRIEPYKTNFESGIETKNRAVYYIGQPQTDGDYIYALCSNAPGSGEDVMSDSELHIFDWEGKAVACYKFDRRISLFALSKKHGKIFAIDNRISNQLFIYDLPVFNE